MSHALQLAVAVAFTLSTAVAHATPLTVPALFGDHMVLQRDCRVPVWGTAAPGATVRVAIAGRTVRTRAGDDGRWSVTLAPLTVGPPLEMVVAGDTGDTLRMRDVLVGEVWLASGQSNMEMPVDSWGKVLDVNAEVANATYPDIRMLTVAHRVAYEPQRDVTTAGWLPCTPTNVKAYSATAYFFARDLHRELGLPVGIIHSAWGGTEIEAWTRAGALAPVEGLPARLAAVRERARVAATRDLRRDFLDASAAWLAAVPKGDLGTTATPPWSARTLDTSAWKPMTLPTGWENAGLPDLDGVVWFRRTVEIPAGWNAQDLRLHLGRIDDVDTTWFDGVAVGHDSVYDRPREYTVPARLVTPGPHVIAVRVYDWIGGGGLWGDAAMMKLERAPGDAIALAGEWSYRVGLDLATLPPRPRDPDDPNQPTVLVNGMIAPLVPYAMRGVIWYQGEQNASRAAQYRTLFPAMIRDWRQAWGRGDFPFLFVQLAAFMAPTAEPSESDWAELREAQAMALALPRTGMATALDVGDATDIHPRNKQEVGRRLALAAMRVAYGRDTLSEGPRFRGMRVAGREVRLRFDHTGGALVSRSAAAPRGYALAGADRKYHWADARIEGDTVVLTCDAVAAPVAVRYAWGANPPCDLVGATGLPAPPFRTDRWPGVTQGRK